MPRSGFELTTSRSLWRQHDQCVLRANHSATLLYNVDIDCLTRQCLTGQCLAGHCPTTIHCVADCFSGHYFAVFCLAVIITESDVVSQTCSGRLCLIYTTLAALYAKICPKFDENLPVRSQFYSDHRVNFSTPTSRQSATFGPLAFCVCPLFLRQKIIKKQQMR